MPDKKKGQDRINLLADVAEMYYIDGQNQEQIAKKVGVTRSMISRMLTEAKELGLITIHINRPLNINHSLSELIRTKYNLQQALIIDHENSKLLHTLGEAAADLLINLLKPNSILGTSWGTAISATADAMAPQKTFPGIKIVQLLGALGARIQEYDGHGIIRKIEEKLGGEAIYLNAPYLVENHKVAQSLFEVHSIRETIELGRKAEIALLGVGSTALENSPYYLAGYISKEEMLSIQEDQAVGDVCGHFFDIEGKDRAKEFQSRLIGIKLQDLMRIPVRVGVAGGPEKVSPILGALRGGYITILVSDASTMQAVIELDQTSNQE